MPIDKMKLKSYYGVETDIGYLSPFSSVASSPSTLTHLTTDNTKVNNKGHLK